ncbi:MAG: hypothetical protein Q9219_003196 [cf. Caloplaca sp. 3 TL-2023]
MGKKKRKHSQFAEDGAVNYEEPAHNSSGLAPTLGHLQAQSQTPQSTGDDKRKAEEKDDEGDGWTVVGKGGKKQKTNHYPSFVYSLVYKQQSSIRISDLQSLVLYCVADGTSPQWISVKSHFDVKKAVVLFVPGLERGMFDGSTHLEGSGSTEEEVKLSDGASSTAKKELSQHVPSNSILHHENHVNQIATSSDDYMPVRLDSENLPEPLKPLADCFEYMWPVKSPGDDRLAKIFSPVQAVLTSPIPKSQEQKDAEKIKKGPKPVNNKHWENKRTQITSFIASKEELQEHEFVLHPVWFETDLQKDAETKRRQGAKQTQESGWVDTQVISLDDGNVPEQNFEQGSLTAGRTVLAMDCEMCSTKEESMALTRISLVGWDGEVIMDELVKPNHPIINYHTSFSGITAEKLAPITTSLSDIQTRLLDILTPQTILIGHSLESDLNALKLTHPYIIDTSLIYPHPRGPPIKSSLKWLAQKYLNREIQKGHGTTGHDSVEDCLACLDLVKLKCEKGPEWGTSSASGESTFKRLSRTSKSGSRPVAEGGQGKTGAIIGHGSPDKSFTQVPAAITIPCATDAEVVQGVQRAVHGDPDGALIPGGGVDFTFARLRELETFRGWSNNHRYDLIQMAPQSQEPASSTALTIQVSTTISYIREIHASLPPCTLLIVYTGTGDVRELARLQELQRTFKREYREKKWDELSVKWTDVEEQALKRACREARKGVGFVGIT